MKLKLLLFQTHLLTAVAASVLAAGVLLLELTPWCLVAVAVVVSLLTPRSPEEKWKPFFQESESSA